MQWSTHTTYVKKQDFMEQMGDMLDFAMRQVNVAHRQEIGALISAYLKNAPPRREGKRRLDGVLRIKFSLVSIKQCEGGGLNLANNYRTVRIYLSLPHRVDTWLPFLLLLRIYFSLPRLMDAYLQICFIHNLF
jgi:hypothetical protein